MDATSTREPTKAVKSSVVFTEQPFEVSERVRGRLGATGQQMAAYIGVPFRTYQRRARRGKLDAAESAKVQMLDALLDLGERVLGSTEEARLWLASPILSLGGERPLDLLDTIKGYERVKNKLLQIEDGTY